VLKSGAILEEATLNGNQCFLTFFLTERGPEVACGVKKKFFSKKENF
jgi:hypothetical protein